MPRHPSSRMQIAVNNANFTADGRQDVIAVRGMTTTPRVITLPPLANMELCQEILILDVDGTTNAVGTLTIVRAGGDVINAGLTTTGGIVLPFFQRRFLAFPSLGRYVMATLL